MRKMQDLITTGPMGVTDYLSGNTRASWEDRRCLSEKGTA